MALNRTVNTKVALNRTLNKILHGEWGGYFLPSLHILIQNCKCHSLYSVPFWEYLCGNLQSSCFLIFSLRVLSPPSPLPLLSSLQTVNCSKDPGVCTPITCTIENFGTGIITISVTSVVDNRYFRVSILQ